MPSLVGILVGLKSGIPLPQNVRQGISETAVFEKKKRMIDMKKMFFLLLSMILAFSLVSCSGETPSSSNSSESTSQISEVPVESEELAGSAESTTCLLYTSRCV